MIVLSKRKKQTSLTPSDVTPSEATGKRSSFDQALDSASGFGPEETSGTRGSGHPSEGVFSREKSSATSAAGFPGREEHPVVRDEAGLAKTHPPSMAQLRMESDPHRPREQHGLAHLGRDEQDAHAGAGPQDLPSARDGHHDVSPAAHVGVYVSPGQTHARPEQDGLGPPDWDQLPSLPPSAYPRGLVPVSMTQLGMVPPEVNEQGFEPPGLGQDAVVPPLVPGRDQQGLELPGTGQPGVVPLSTHQRGVRLPGADRHGTEQPGMDESAVGPLGTDQPELVPFGIDQYGIARLGTDQQGLAPLLTDQRALVSPGLMQQASVQPILQTPGIIQPGIQQYDVVQPGTSQLYQPGMVQPGADQPAFVQPGTGQPGLVQPGAGQPGLVQPGAGQPGLVQPGAGQPGLVQPGMDQRGLVQPGMDQRGLVQPGMDQRGLVQPGMDQPDLVQPGTDQPGLVLSSADQRDLVQPGMYPPDLVQPGAYPPGLVQPGAYPPGLVQPGAYPPGLVQPGAYAPGLGQPGAYPPGLVQPGAYPRGLVQPGAYPSGLVQPGAYPPGLVQPGAYPRGLVQPIIDQRGLRQLGADEQGLIPSGTEVQGFPPFYSDSRSLTSPRPYQHALVPPSRARHGQVSPLLAKQGLTSPGVDHKGLVPTKTYQQRLMPPGTYQRGPIPPSIGVESAPSYRQHLVSPGPYQGGQAYPSEYQRDYRGPMYPGPRGPGYPGVDQYVRLGSDQKQPETSIKTTPGQEGTFLRSEVQSERHDSLDKLAPSFPIAVETFRLIGELIGLYMELKENMKNLDEEKAGQTDVEKIQYLLAQMVQKTMPPDLQEQLKTLKTLAKDVRQEKVKLDRMQRILEDEGHLDVGKEIKASQLGLQLGILRVTVADIEKELSELRESQERGKVSMEHSVSEASLYLQDQLDKLRTIIENMLASSSTLLSMSMAPQKTPTPLVPGEIRPEATCPACSLDLGHQVSTLVQRYEQLQDMVNSLAASRPSKKAKLQGQDEELLGHVQSAILQVQGDCEKLNITTSSLIEDHRQKQRDINVLYQGLEKLEKEKANRAHLDMEIDVVRAGGGATLCAGGTCWSFFERLGVEGSPWGVGTWGVGLLRGSLPWGASPSLSGQKADKSALAAKVSRVQFDATTEQLNHMMQELVAKMSGQEQDWQKMLDRLLTEMDNKLDRLELDPVKQLLEDRWKSLRQQLKERSPLYQADEAAAMRRQLLAHFHCLSCDRPLETPVTGQILPVTPVGPYLLGHRSTRPYTIFELEQVRQHSRNLKLGGTALPRAELAQTERSVGRLRTMHSKMLMDIEKVQIHFGGSVKASSQMIRELLQAQCLSHPCYKRVPEVADYTYWTVPRHCGGSHTLTHPQRRSRLQHLSQSLYPSEEVQIAMKAQRSPSTRPSHPGPTCTGNSPSSTTASCPPGLRALTCWLPTPQLLLVNRQTDQYPPRGVSRSQVRPTRPAPARWQQGWGCTWMCLLGRGSRSPPGGHGPPLLIEQSNE
ncbi:glutamine-rich protein 2 isoform X1 [Rhinolophus sinicus]|uniref:glutamine-rich protein 2 isoform X1 n=1 Tax=Rhinolophus sinicus TaxID=89399 RepID=UPI003D7C053F